MLHSMSQHSGAGAAVELHYYAGLADTFAFEESGPTAGGQFGLLVREPVGVVGAIIPWNGPGGLVSKVAPALIAGCTVIVKASPEAPAAAYILAEIAEKIGLPTGVVNVVTADREVSELLVRHPGVDKISFTGSTAAGRRIASICGERIARCTLELGGKSPAIVLDDYDLANAAERSSRMPRCITGQVCSSLTRLIVTRRRHDEFVDALSRPSAASRSAIRSIRQARWDRWRWRASATASKAISPKGKERARRWRPAAAGRAHLNRGYFIEPTVFGNVDNNSTIAREEIFGPVLSVIPADDEEQAIEIANDTIYGLNSSVFTNDPDRAYAVGRQIPRRHGRP